MPSSPTSSTQITTPTEATRLTRLWLNSTTAFVLAASVAVTLHESAHAVAGLAQHSPVVLGSFSADSTHDLGRTGSAIMTAAGPLFSLVFGLAMILLCRNAGRGFGRLFWMWLGFISVQNFVGYLVITPFGAGDSGAFVDELGLGIGWVIAFCAVGLAGYLLLAWTFLHQAVRYIDSAAELRRIALLAWLCGTAVVVLRTGLEAVVSGAPAGTVTIVMAGAASVGVFVPIFTRAWPRASATADHQQLRLSAPWGWLVLAVVIIIVQILVLAPGIRLG